MTRKTALLAAVRLLSADKTNRETVLKLKELAADLPAIHWSDNAIRDAVEQFIEDHGRVPTVTDFRQKNLPSHTVIRQKYGVSLAVWLKENYPSSPVLSHAELKRTYTEAFLADYARIKPSGGDAFNKNRTLSKSWQTVAKYHAVGSWGALLHTLGLQQFDAEKRKNRAPLRVHVIVDKEWEKA